MIILLLVLFWHVSGFGPLSFTIIKINNIISFDLNVVISLAYVSIKPNMMFL